MNPTTERLKLIAATFQPATAFTGPLSPTLLAHWLAAELGSATALDEPVAHGDLLSQARPHSPILHVVSSNTPHAAFQSLLRGLVLGATNLIKIPQAGLPAFEAFTATLPESLARLTTVARQLPDAWLTAAQLAVVFGRDSTVAALRARLPATTGLIAHGHRLSIGVIHQPDDSAAQLAAADVGEHDQQGCLSLQALYVAGGTTAAREFCPMLAAAMHQFQQSSPRLPLSPSQAGAIRNARELVRFRSANGEPTALWESHASTAWTVVFEEHPALQPGPLNRFVRVHPLPDRLAELGDNLRHLSTVAIHPFSLTTAQHLAQLPATRFCPLGRAQHPSAFWHHDGLPTLASMVTWRDFG